MGAHTLIEGFSTGGEGYYSSRSAPLPAYLKVEGSLGDNELYWKAESTSCTVTIRAPGVSGCRLFFGERLQGSLAISLRGDGSTLYVGDDCEFAGLELRSRQPEDLIAIGNGVAVTGPGTWISGLRSPAGARPQLIVGDCCLFSRDVLLRNTDGHPVYALADDRLLNGTAKPLIIEPHAWLGERSAILKGVTVGAFARIGLGAVVTRDVPRYAVAAGVPALCRIEAERYWSWEDTPESRARARHFLDRFPPMSS